MHAVGATSNPDPVSQNPMSASFAQVFVNACVLGELRLPKASLRETTWEDVRGFPYELPKKGSTSHYYRIKTDFDAILTVTEFAASRNGEERLCSLSTGRADLFTVFSVVIKKLGIPESPKQVNSTDEYVITVPERRYVVSLRQGYASTTMFDAATSAKMLADQRKTKTPRIRAYNWDYQ